MNSTTLSSASISPVLKSSRSLALFKTSRTALLKPLKCSPSSSHRSYHAPKSLIMPRSGIHRLTDNSPSTVHYSGLSAISKTPEPVEQDYMEAASKRRTRGETPSSTSITMYESKDYGETRKTYATSFSRDYSSARKTYVPRKESEKERSPERMIKIKQCVQELGELSIAGNQEPTAKRGRLCYRVLELLSSNPYDLVSEEGQYQKEMEILKEEVNNAMFCNSQEILDRIEVNFPGVVGRGKVFAQPYFELIKRIIKFFETYKKVAQTKYNEQDKQIEALKQEMSLKDDKIKELLKGDNTIIEQKAQKIEDAFENIVLEIGTLKTEKAALLEEMNKIKENTADMLDNTERTLMDQYGSRLRALTASKNAIQEVSVQKDDQIEQLKSTYSKLLLVHQSSVVKLKANKQEIDLMKARIHELEDENCRLAVRAAVGFDQLTPRPTLDSVIDHFSVDIKKKDSTQRKVELIKTAIEEINTKPKGIDRTNITPENSKSG